jgi:hypothetical protein
MVRLSHDSGAQLGCAGTLVTSDGPMLAGVDDVPDGDGFGVEQEFGLRGPPREHVGAGLTAQVQRGQRSG